MNISIVIPTYDRALRLVQLLESIRKLNSQGLKYETIVVCNSRGELDNLLPLSYQYADIAMKVDCVGRLSVNGARNLGIKKAQGNIILLVDDDCLFVDPDYLHKIIKQHTNYKEAVAIGGSYGVLSEASPVDKAYNVISRVWQSHTSFGSYQSTRLVGGNVSYKKQLLDKSELLFNESISFGGTEAEFHQKLAQKGYKTLCLSSLQVIHQTCLDEEAFVEKAALQGQGQYLYNIESGYSREQNHSYNNLKTLFAFEVAKDEKEFQKIMAYIKLYDSVFKFSSTSKVSGDKGVGRIRKNWAKECQVRGIEC